MQKIIVLQLISHGKCDLLYLSVGICNGIESTRLVTHYSTSLQYMNTIFPSYPHHLLSVLHLAARSVFTSPSLTPSLALLSVSRTQSLVSSCCCLVWLHSAWEAGCHRGDRGQMWLT